MKRFTTLTHALTLVTLRNPQSLFWNLVFPVFLLVIYKFVFGSYSVGTADYMTWVVPGVVALNIMSFGLVGGSSNIVSMRETGVLRRLRATPLPPLQLVLANMITFVAICLLQTVVIVLAARLLFGVAYPASHLLLALPLILVSIIAFVALGQVISGIAPKMGIALALGQILYFSQMFISDMVIPLSQLPAWLRAIVPWLPSFAMGDLIRSAFLQGSAGARGMINMLILLAYGLVSAWIAGRYFRWDPKA